MEKIKTYYRKPYTILSLRGALATRQSLSPTWGNPATPCHPGLDPGSRFLCTLNLESCPFHLSPFVIPDHPSLSFRAKREILQLVISIQSRHCEEPQRRGNLVTLFPASFPALCHSRLDRESRHHTVIARPRGPRQSMLQNRLPCHFERSEKSFFFNSP
jgi:hypothetical protein